MVIVTDYINSRVSPSKKYSLAEFNRVVNLMCYNLAHPKNLKVGSSNKKSSDSTGQDVTITEDSDYAADDGGLE